MKFRLFDQPGSSTRKRGERRGTFYSTEDDLRLYAMIVGREPDAVERRAALAPPEPAAPPDHSPTLATLERAGGAVIAFARRVAHAFARKSA
jgi:hypothetical protein